MTDVPRFPAGWYADPDDPTVHRWWDGQRWTDARQPAYGMTPPQPAPVPPQPPLQQQAPVYPSAPAYAAYPTYPAAPAYPAGSGHPAAPAHPAAPGYPAASEPEVRRDIRTNTVWIWLVVLLPLLAFPTLLLFDWGGSLEDVVRGSAGPGNGESWMLAWGVGSIAITLLSYVLVAAQIVFAWLDWRTLRRRGVERPFHWAWIFFTLVITNGVYVIGRGVVLRRRTGSGLAPVWAWIAVTVLGWILTAVFVAALLDEIFAVLSREGLLTS